SPQPLDNRFPIEALVEREAVRPVSATVDLRQAAEAGLYFLRLLSSTQLPSTIATSYLTAYPLGLVASTNNDAISSVISGRVIDGIKLHADLVAAGANLPATPAIPTAQQNT